MHIAAFLVDLDRYRERAMVMAMAARDLGARLTLITSTPPREAALEALPNTTIRPFGTRARRRPVCQAQLLRWWHLNREPVDLLLDTTGFMSPLFLSLSGRRDRPPRVTWNFASTWEWFEHLRGRWPVEWRAREMRYWTSAPREHFVARVADAYIVLGEGHRAPFARFFRVPEARVFGFPGVADAAWFGPAEPADLGFGPDARVLGFVGDVFRYKGIHEALECVARLAPRWPDLRMFIAGRQPPESIEPFEAAVDRLGVRDRIVLLGRRPREELSALLAAAEVMVMPSYAEGSPRAVIEAMACGRPIVAARIAGVESLDPSGASLRLVPRADAGALTEAVASLLADPDSASALGERARARQLVALTPEASARNLADVLRTVLSWGGAPP